MKALKLKTEIVEADLSRERYEYVTDQEAFKKVHRIDHNGIIHPFEGEYTYTNKKRYKRYILDKEKEPKQILYAERLSKSKTQTVKGFGHPGSKAFKRQVKRNLRASLSEARKDQLRREAANKKKKSRKRA